VADNTDSVDEHVARWEAYWKDDPAWDGEVEGALVRMSHIRRTLRRGDVAAFAQAGDFTLEDYQTLHALMVQPWPAEATPAQLAEVLNVTRAAVTSRLDRLVAAELVTRETDPADRRRVLIRPTPAGRAAWNRYIFEGMARDQAALGTLTRDELLTLNTLLRKVVRGLDS
jgi:DNA-binding MarR family transcriptional regulator